MVRRDPAAARALDGDARCVRFGSIGPFDAAFRSEDAGPFAGAFSAAMDFLLGGEGWAVLVVGAWLP